MQRLLKPEPSNAELSLFWGREDERKQDEGLWFPWVDGRQEAFLHRPHAGLCGERFAGENISPAAN